MQNDTLLKFCHPMTMIDVSIDVEVANWNIVYNAENYLCQKKETLQK